MAARKAHAADGFVSLEFASRLFGEQAIRLLRHFELRAIRVSIPRIEHPDRFGGFYRFEVVNISAVLVFKNRSGLTALREMYRVLRPGGGCCSAYGVQ